MWSARDNFTIPLMNTFATMDRIRHFCCQVSLSTLCIALIIFASSLVQAEEIASPPTSEKKIPVKERLADANFKKLYYEARINFSAHPDVFLEVIDLMDSKKSSFTPLQLQKLAYLKAYRHFIDGDADNAITDMERLYPKLLTKDLQYKVALLIINAGVYAKNYNAALYYLREAEQLLPEVKNKVRAGSYHTMAINIYRELNQFDLALDHAHAFLSLPNLSDSNLCEGHFNQIEVLFEQKTLQSNSPEIRQGITACTKKAGLQLMLIHSMRASLLLSENKNEEALALVTKLSNQLEETSFKMLRAGFSMHAAQAYLQMGNVELAIEKGQKSLEIYGNESRPRSLTEIFNILHTAHKEQGDFEKALFYFKAYTEEKQHNLNENAEKLLSFQLAKFKITEKLNEIEALNNQNELLLLEQKLTKENEQNNQLIIMLLMVTVLFLVLWMYRSNQVQKQLKEIAQVDALTRIANRRYFTEVANKHLRLSLQNKTPLSLLLFDLDKFKSINDTYGHGIGDWVLIETAKVCKDSIRESDMIGRLGGEEFGILLPNCDREQAVSIAEKCRKALLAIDTEETEFKFRVSGSFGVSDVAESGYTLKDILHNCDEALYEAKHRGRNQVVEYPFEAIASEVN